MTDEGKNNKKMTVDMWIQKSTKLYRSGRHEEELICYDEALKIAKNNVELNDILFNRILALEALNRNNEAIDCYNKLFELDEVDKSFLWSHREALLLDIGKYREAIAYKLNEADKFFQDGQYDKAVSWYGSVEFLLQYLKDEYNTDLFKEYAEIYHKRSVAKLYLDDEKGAIEDKDIYHQITGQV